MWENRNLHRWNSLLVNNNLKVLSREMDLAKEVSIDRSSGKGEARRFLEKSFERPLKLQRHLVQILAIRNLIANGAEKIHYAVGMGRARFVGTSRNGATGILAHLPIAPRVHCGFSLEK
jgi:hypothetical protein